MAQTRVLSFSVPCGKGGLNRMDNYVDFPIEDLAWMDGIDVSRNMWEKQGGAAKFNSSALAAGVLAVHDTWNSAPSGDTAIPEATTQKMTAIINSTTGTIKTLNTSATQLATQDLAAVPTNPWIVDGVIRNVLRSQFLFSGNAYPLYTVPETYSWQTTAYPADDWVTNTDYPHFGFTHNFRMLCATKLNSVLYMSSPNDHAWFDNTRPNTRVMDIFPGEQHYIAGGVSWRGRAYLFKWERGVYFVDDSDSNIANWTTKKLTDAVGVAGPGSVLAYEDDVIFLGADGYFYSLSDVATLGQRSVRPIFPAELGDFIRQEVNIDQLALVKSLYYARKRQIWFFLPATGTSVLNRRLVLDMNMPDRVRILWSERDEMNCVGIRRTSNTMEPLWGDADGYIWKGDTATKSKDAAAYTSQFETPPYEIFPLGNRYANLKELQVNFHPEGDYDVTLEVHADTTLAQTLTLSQQSTGSPTGSFSADSDVTGGTTIATGVQRLEGECRRVKFVGKNAGAGENFALQSMNIRFTPGSHSSI